MVKRNEQIRADYQEQDRPLKKRGWSNSLLNYYSMISHSRYVFGRTLNLSEDMPKNTEKKEGPEVPQRKNVLLAGIAVGLILIVVVAAFILVQPSPGSVTAYPPSTKIQLLMIPVFHLRTLQKSQERYARQEPRQLWRQLRYKPQQQFLLISSSSPEIRLHAG